MNSIRCSTHSGVEATHRCEGCSKLLCADCIEEGHRLLFCRLCREQAVPIAPEAAATAPQFARQQKRAQPYSWGQALLYVFRGYGVYVFGSYLGALALLALLGLLPIVGAAAGCVTLIFVLLVLFLVPGTLYSIVRTTAAGGDELPDWPDLIMDFGDRVAEIFGFVLTLLISCIPLVFLLKLSDCLSSLGPDCWLMIAVGWFVAFALWAPAFGAIAVFHNNWLAFRIDRHVVAIARLGSDLWITALLSTLLITVGQILSLALALTPVVGLIASAAAGMYGWFTAAHLVGVLFRRHHLVLKDIYGRS